MTARNITRTGQASSCYFRTTADGSTRKALVQIDERCNLHCAHCFVSATRAGQSMPYDDITGLLIPRLKACRVERVTLTGGEPTIHPHFTGIVRALRDAGMQVGFCTNATTLTDAQLSELAGIGGVHANVSLDGFRPESHGRFRGDRGSFAVTVGTVRKLAAAGLLQGLLCTPNSLAEDEEYRELCDFATRNGASYVLMNPLSSMGRGVKSRSRLSSSEEHMRRIRALTAPFDSPDLEIVHIRFPSTDGQPLAGCEAGTIIYVFTAGEVTVCPYPHNRRLALSTAECSGPAGCTLASSSRESGSRSPVSWSVTEVPIRKRLHSVSASPTARLRCADDAALTDSRAASRHAALLVRAGIGVVIAASGLDCWLTRGNQAAHVQGPASMVVLLPWSSCSRRATNRTVGRTAGMQGC